MLDTCSLLGISLGDEDPALDPAFVEDIAAASADSAAACAAAAAAAADEDPTWPDPADVLVAAATA